MKDFLQYAVLGLLLLSSILLSILVPGGPIETREFSHISPLILAGFNVFLTSLSIVSLLLIYFIWRRRHWAFGAAAICGIAYFAVYALDLAHWFPVSPDAMPFMLFTVEIAGAIISVPLIVLSAMGMGSGAELSDDIQYGNQLNDVLSADNIRANEREKSIVFVVAAIAALSGVGIVIFATSAAMCSQSLATLS